MHILPKLYRIHIPQLCEICNNVVSNEKDILLYHQNDLSVNFFHTDKNNENQMIVFFTLTEKELKKSKINKSRRNFTFKILPGDFIKFYGEEKKYIIDKLIKRRLLSKIYIQMKYKGKIDLDQFKDEKIIKSFIKLFCNKIKPGDELHTKHFIILRREYFNYDLNHTYISIMRKRSFSFSLHFFNYKNFKKMKISGDKYFSNPKILIKCLKRITLELL